MIQATKKRKKSHSVKLPVHIYHHRVTPNYYTSLESTAGAKTKVRSVLLDAFATAVGLGTISAQLLQSKQTS